MPGERRTRTARRRYLTFFPSGVCVTEMPVRLSISGGASSPPCPSANDVVRSRLSPLMAPVRGRQQTRKTTEREKSERSASAEERTKKKTAKSGRAAQKRQLTTSACGQNEREPRRDVGKERKRDG